MSSHRTQLTLLSIRYIFFICNYFLKKTIPKSLLLNLICVQTLLYNKCMKDVFKEYHDPRCEVCLSHPCELDCPKDYLENDTEELNTIVGLFDDYDPDEDILGTKLSEVLGNHLFLIADAILSAQRKWEQKTYMNRIDDTLSTYRFYTNFTQALYDANAFDTIEDLMDYIKSPKHYDKLYNMWSELNHPQSKDSTFKIFEHRVRDFKDLQL